MKCCRAIPRLNPTSRITCGFVWLILLFFSGCSTNTPRVARTRPVALALTTTNTLPSAEQIEQTYDALRPQLAEQRLHLAAKGQPADFVISVRFTQSVTGAGGGQATIMGIEPTAQFRDSAIQTGSEDLQRLRSRMGEYQSLINRTMSSQQ